MVGARFSKVYYFSLKVDLWDLCKECIIAEHNNMHNIIERVVNY